MSGFLGADTEALRELAGTFQDRSARLGELKDQLSSIVMREDIWIGSDADSFRSEWQGISGRFDFTAEDVGRRREELERNAEEQDEVSDPSDGSLWDRLGDMFGGLKDLLDSGFKDLGKAIKDIRKGVKSLQLFNDLQKLGKAGYEAMKDLINQQFIDELVDITRKPAGKILDFINGKGWDTIGRFAESVLDSGVVKGLGEIGGKLLPALDIGMGIHQIVTAEDGWDVAAGGLSVLSGGLILAAPFTGPFAPIVAGAGVIAGGVSLAIDAGKAIVENWDTITQTAGDVWNGAVDIAGDVAQGVADVASNAWKGFTSLFA